MGVPLPAQPPASALQQPVASQEQYQLPGHIHDQRGAVLRGASHLRRDGDVSCGAAAVPPRKGLSLHIRLLRGDCYVPHHGGRCSSARLAVILHEKAVRLVVQHHSGEEEEVTERKKMRLGEKLCFYFNLFRSYRFYLCLPLQSSCHVTPYIRHQ